ncbi:protein of unknown function [Burkholderia multivorans]
MAGASWGRPFFDHHLVAVPDSSRQISGFPAFLDARFAQASLSASYVVQAQVWSVTQVHESHRHFTHHALQTIDGLQSYLSAVRDFISGRKLNSLVLWRPCVLSTGSRPSISSTG